jgi:predicted RNase H-like HicB family nuclease
MRFTIILTPDDEDGGYVAECPAIAGCVSEGDTVDEALANMREAIAGCLESLVAHRLPMPHDIAVIVASAESALNF